MIFYEDIFVIEETGIGPDTIDAEWNFPQTLLGTLEHQKRYKYFQALKCHARSLWIEIRSRVKDVKNGPLFCGVVACFGPFNKLAVKS
jgi:hypothetical protein